MFRCLSFVLLTALLMALCHGLPFGKATRKDSDEDDQRNLEAETDANGEVMKFLRSRDVPISRRNAVVELFFAGDDSANDYSEELIEEVHREAVDLTPFIRAIRRELHKHPEVMYKERETSEHIQAVLTELGITYTTGWSVNTHRDRIEGPGGYGIVADIGSGKEPCVLLRADMDALPIVERTEGVDSFKSRNQGRMHACGHDGHTTMLLGAASILKSMEESINGTVRLMFQPAEEGGAGAKRMIEEGLLEQQPKPQQAFAMHLWPTLPSGSVASRPGPLLAAAEMFEILVSGVGGHGAMPHLTVDPIVAASAMVMNLQTVVARTISPLESGVVSVTKFSSGDAFNIIPASAVLGGTIRALSTDMLLTLRDRVQNIVNATAITHGCNITITFSADYYPPTVNDPELFETFSSHVGSLLSVEKVIRTVEPTMGGEDFAFVAEEIPSTFFFLGQGSGGNADEHTPTNYGLHHPHFAIDETVLPQGSELHVNLALRALRRLGDATGEK